MAEWGAAHYLRDPLGSENDALHSGRMEGVFRGEQGPFARCRNQLHLDWPEGDLALWWHRWQQALIEHCRIEGE